MFVCFNPGFTPEYLSGLEFCPYLFRFWHSCYCPNNLQKIIPVRNKSTCLRDLFSNSRKNFLMILWNTIWGLPLERIREGCVISIHKVISSPCRSSKINKISKYFFGELEKLNWRKDSANTLVITYANLIMICKPSTFPTAFATAFEKVHLLQASFLSSLEMLNVEKCEW